MEFKIRNFSGLLLIVMMTYGCGFNVNTQSSYNTSFGLPIQQMATKVCNSSGYELTVLQTFYKDIDGNVRMIDSNYVGGAGIGYALGVGVAAGSGPALIGGVSGIIAARELKPDQTNVTQTGSGIVGMNVTGNSGTISGGTSMSNNITVNQTENK